MNERDTSPRLVLLLVAVGFVAMFLSTSIKSIYQVYFADLAGAFGAGRARFAWSGSLFMLVVGLVSPIVGTLSDRVGPLRTALIGSVSGGLGLIVAGSSAASLPVFGVAYGLLGAFGLSAMTYVPMGVLVDRLFEASKTGIAYAVVTNGTAIGFIVLSPLWLWLQPRVAWSDAFVAAGLVLAVPMAACIAASSRRASAAGLFSGPPAARENGESAWRRVRSDTGFYALAIGLFACGATMAFVDVHLVAYWQDVGAPRSGMGASLSLLGLLELASGLATGWLAIRCSKRALLAFFYALRTVAIALLLVTEPTFYTVVFAALFGGSYLGTVILTSMFCLERYGAAIKGRAFGLLFLVHQLGAFASVQLGAMVFDDAGTYRPFVAALAVLTTVAAVASWLGLRPAVATTANDPS